MWSRALVFISIVLFGASLGVGTFTLFYAEGFSYLSNNPKACINCHIMKENYYTWENSSHHGFATCNTCHASGNTVQKYVSKAINGFNHSLAFTTGNYHYPLQIKDFNKKIVQRACYSCHEGMLSISHTQYKDNLEKLNCLNCHKEVGHRR